jgi:hypothetical protein
MKTTFDQLRDTQPQFFSAVAIAIPAAAMQAMAELIAAIESVIACRPTRRTPWPRRQPSPACPARRAAPSWATTST